MKAAVKLAVLALVSTDLQAGAQNTTAAGQRRGLKITQGKTQPATKKPAAKAGQKTPRSAVTTKKLRV